MPLEFVKSQKGKPMLLSNGYLFVQEKQEKQGDRKVIWKCSKYKTIKCPARIHTALELVVYVSDRDHNHAPDPAKAAAKKVISEIKEQAATSQEATRQILSATMAGLTKAVEGQLPPEANLKKIVQKVRRDELGAVPNPRSIEELVIPDAYQQTHDGELFLQWDSGADDGPNRILLFATDRNLELLAQSHH